MQALTWDVFGRLARADGGLRASVYVPLGPLGDVRPGLVRLDRALSEAAEQLRAHGLDPDEASAWTTAARELVDGDPDLQAGGAMALFLTAGSAAAVHIAEGAGPHVHVGGQYLVRPLVAALQGDGTFFILALSRSGLRLLRCSRTTVEAVDEADLDRPIDEVLVGEEYPRDLQLHSFGGDAGGQWSGTYHGHGGEPDTVKDRDLRYFQALDPHVRKALGTSGAPVVLAGVEPLVPEYRHVSDYPYLVKGYIAGSPRGPRDVPDDVLHERALPLVAPVFGQAAQREADRYAFLAGTGLATADLPTIAAKARVGLVDTLFLLRDAVAWGRHDAATASVEVHAERGVGDEDLVNGAVIDAYRTGGRLYAQLPFGLAPGSALAAILRA
jgi:hypothetical protein